MQVARAKISPASPYEYATTFAFDDTKTKVSVLDSNITFHYSSIDESEKSDVTINTGLGDETTPKSTITKITYVNSTTASRNIVVTGTVDKNGKVTYKDEANATIDASVETALLSANKLIEKLDSTKSKALQVKIDSINSEEVTNALLKKAGMTGGKTKSDITAGAITGITGPLEIDKDGNKISITLSKITKDATDITKVKFNYKASIPPTSTTKTMPKSEKEVVIDGLKDQQTNQQIADELKTQLEVITVQTSVDVSTVAAGTTFNEAILTNLGASGKGKVSGKFPTDTTGSTLTYSIKTAVSAPSDDSEVKGTLTVHIVTDSTAATNPGTQGTADATIHFTVVNPDVAAVNSIKAALEQISVIGVTDKIDADTTAKTFNQSVLTALAGGTVTGTVPTDLQGTTLKYTIASDIEKGKKGNITVAISKGSVNKTANISVSVQADALFDVQSELNKITDLTSTKDESTLTSVQGDKTAVELGITLPSGIDTSKVDVTFSAGAFANGTLPVTVTVTDKTHPTNNTHKIIQVSPTHKVTKYVFNGQKYNSMNEAKAALNKAKAAVKVYVVDGKEYKDINEAKKAWLAISAQSSAIVQKTYRGASITDGTEVSTLTEATAIHKVFKVEGKWLGKTTDQVFANKDDALTAIATFKNTTSAFKPAEQGTATATISGSATGTIDLPNFDFGSDPTNASVEQELTWSKGTTSGKEAKGETPSSVALTLPSGFTLTTGETTQTLSSFLASGNAASGDITVGIKTKAVAQTTATPGVWTATVAGQTLKITGPSDGTGAKPTDVNNFVDFSPATDATPTPGTLAVKTNLTGTVLNGYTVTTTGKYGGKAVDLKAVAIKETKAPATGVAGIWTATLDGATFEITGPSDGSNPAKLSKVKQADLENAFDYTPPSSSTPTSATLAVKSTGLPAGFTATLSGNLDTTAKDISAANGRINETTAPKQATTGTNGVYIITFKQSSWTITGTSPSSTPPTVNSVTLTISGGNSAITESRSTTFTLQLNNTNTTVTKVVAGDPTAPAKPGVAVIITKAATKATPWDKSNLTTSDKNKVSEIHYLKAVTKQEDYVSTNVDPGSSTGFVYGGKFYTTIALAQTEQVKTFNIPQTNSTTMVTVNGKDYDTVEAAIKAEITTTAAPGLPAIRPNADLDTIYNI